MAITLSAAYLAELKKGENTHNVILEVELDSGTVKWGEHDGGFDDVLPVITAINSLENRIDPDAGYSTRGQITVTISGRDFIKSIIPNEFITNRKVTRKEGWVSSGYAYSDYAPTFTGTITDWERNGDSLTLTITDDLKDASRLKIPAENDNKTQTLILSNMNPVDMMMKVSTNSSLLALTTVTVDSSAGGSFQTERDIWLNTWKYDRVLTDPELADDILNALQKETNSNIIHDGEKIAYKVFAPALPEEVIEKWNDDDHILDGTASQESGLDNNFANRIVVLYDYDESGGDNYENYESILIAVDGESQSTSAWAEVKTKEIKSKYIRNFTFTQPSTATFNGVTPYHVSFNNGVGAGTLNLTYSGTTASLAWTPPNGTEGEAKKVTKAGKYLLEGADKTKSCRVVVDTTLLPVANSTTITISNLDGDQFANTIGQKLLSRFRNPRSEVKFSIDINHVAFNSEFIKPTDLKDITSDEFFEKGDSSWANERCMLISVRPYTDNDVVEIEALETAMYHKYGFIAPAGYNGYSSANSTELERAYIADSSGFLGPTDVAADFIW